MQKHTLKHIMNHIEVTVFCESEIITWFAYSVWVKQLIQLASKMQRCLWAQIVSETEREFHTSHMAGAFNPNSFTVPSVHNSTESVNMMTGMQRKEGDVGDESVKWTVRVRVSMYWVSGPGRLLLLMTPVLNAG